MECSTCGNKEARNVRIRFIPTTVDGNGKVVDSVKEETCNLCNSVKLSYARDSLGNKVKVTNDVIGKFSYATGEPILGQRQYADTLRRMNLAQKE